MGQLVEVVRESNQLSMIRKRRIVVHSCKKKRAKKEVKAEMKLISFSTPIINVDDVI